MSELDNTFNSLRPNRETGFGSITMMIQNASTGSPEETEPLFVAVMQQLRESARNMLRKFPRVNQLNEDMLVNDIYASLQKKLIAKTFVNREHLFATACLHFRWLLLDQIKKTNLETEVLHDDDLAMTEDENILQTVQADFLQFALEHLDQLDASFCSIVHKHIFLDMTFAEIAMESGIPSSTISDRFHKAIALLKKEFDT